MKITGIGLLAVSACALGWPLRAAAQRDFDNVGAERCEGHLTRLRGPDLAAMLTGRQITLSTEPGVCPGGLRVTSPWILDLQADHHFVLEVDRGFRTGGEYYFADDQLCVGVAALPGCARFYRDDGGRIYMFGVPNPNSVPTVINGVYPSHN